MSSSEKNHRRKFFITSSTTELSQEIEDNIFIISGSRSDITDTTRDEIINFINHQKESAFNQLTASPEKIDLIFYIWFDKQDGTLAMNFINSNHPKLPFGCQLNFVTTQEDIVDEFINSPYLDGIDLDELIEVELDEEDDDEPPFILNVYSERIHQKR